ncbi:hypothetical protein [Rosettibacter firmus]|uniref:hypothetical protein n=1 Tax=Rosettibacter firmus TaxID=3111522 RepID=UPI00336C058C
MKKVLFLGALLIFSVTSCITEKIVEPIVSDELSGQYQSVPYTSIEAEPIVILLLSHEGNKVYGTGSWNAITFNFEGTVINKHVILTFTLKDTNVGNINGDIDGWVGNDNSIAGGYKLWNSYQLFNGPIRLKLVQKLDKRHDQGQGY